MSKGQKEAQVRSLVDLKKEYHYLRVKYDHLLQITQVLVSNTSMERVLKNLVVKEETDNEIWMTYAILTVSRSHDENYLDQTLTSILNEILSLETSLSKIKILIVQSTI